MNPFLPEVAIEKVSLLPSSEKSATGGPSMIVRIDLRLDKVSDDDFSDELVEKYLNFFRVRLFATSDIGLYKAFSGQKQVTGFISYSIYDGFLFTMGYKKWNSSWKNWVKGAEEYFPPTYPADYEARMNLKTFTNNLDPTQLSDTKDFDFASAFFVKNEVYDSATGQLMSIENLHAKDELFFSYSIKVPADVPYLGFIARAEMDVERIKEDTTFGKDLHLGAIEGELQGQFFGKLTTATLLEFPALQDFRTIVSDRDDIGLENIEKLFLLTKITAGTPKAFQDYLVKHGSSIFSDQVIFSDILASHTPDGTVKFCFFMDFETLFFKHSIVSNLQVQWYLPWKEAQIYSFKIKRRRVENKSSKTILPKEEIVKILELPKIIVKSHAISDPGFHYPHGLKLLPSKNFVPDSVNLGQDTTELIASLKEEDMGNQQHRLFQVVDSEISNYSAGTYQYGVEVEIEDITIKGLKMLLAGVQVRLTYLKTNFTKDSIIREFDSRKNKFTPKGKKVLYSFWDHMTSGNDWFFTLPGMAVTTGPSQLGVFDQLNVFLHPETITPESIMLIIDLFSHFTYQIESTLSSYSNSKIHKKEENTGGYLFNKTAKKSASEPTMITIEHWFPTLVEQKNSTTGYEFIDETQALVGDPNLGLMGLSLITLRERLDRERKKFFKEGLPAANFQPKFLSMENFWTQSTSSPTRDMDLYFTHKEILADKIFLEAVRFKQGFIDRTSWSASQNKIDKSLEQIFGKENCTFEPISDPPPFDPFGNILGTGAVENTEQSAINSIQGKASKNVPTRMLQSLLVAYNRPAYTINPMWSGPSALLGKLAIGQLSAEQMNDLTLFIVNNFDTFRTSPDYLSLYWLLFENIVEIEYLNIGQIQQYKIATVSESGAASWSPLQLDGKILKISPGKYLCRLKRVVETEMYAQQGSKIVSPLLAKQTKLPIFNKYFMLEI